MQEEELGTEVQEEEQGTEVQEEEQGTEVQEEEQGTEVQEEEQGTAVQKEEQGTEVGEPVWPSGKALVRLDRRRTSVRICFGSPFSSKVVVCGHCLVTLSLTIMKH